MPSNRSAKCKKRLLQEIEKMSFSKNKESLTVLLNQFKKSLISYDIIWLIKTVECFLVFMRKVI